MPATLANWSHICVDMQRMFAEDTPWRVAWMKAVSQQVVEVAGRHAGRTIFTRFIPPEDPDQAPGMWRSYYQKWWMMTRKHIAPELLGLVPELARCCPPGIILDKRTYSPWIDGRLHAELQRRRANTIVVTGGETDICVLATVLGGIDLGYRIIVLKDAVCSGADETYDASLTLLGDRFSVQLELMTTDEFLSSAR